MPRLFLQYYWSRILGMNEKSLRVQHQGQRCLHGQDLRSGCWVVHPSYSCSAPTLLNMAKTFAQTVGLYTQVIHVAPKANAVYYCNHAACACFFPCFLYQPIGLVSCTA